LKTPTTSIDRRYSDPDAQPVSWADTQSILSSAQLFWISTVRADGRPHVTPLIAAWYDGALYFHTGSGEQKFKNLTVHPQVILTTGANTWDTGIDVIVEGIAAIVTDEVVLRKVAELFATQWDGRWQLEMRDGRYRNHDDGNEWYGEVFQVTPTKVFAHSKGDPFGQTRHLFT
jgi:general stress protein 26